MFYFVIFSGRLLIQPTTVHLTELHFMPTFRPIFSHQWITTSYHLTQWSQTSETPTILILGHSLRLGPVSMFLPGQLERMGPDIIQLNYWSTTTSLIRSISIQTALLTAASLALLLFTLIKVMTYLLEPFPLTVVK